LQFFAQRQAVGTSGNELSPFLDSAAQLQSVIDQQPGATRRNHAMLHVAYPDGSQIHD
jgi:hypothetical protein